MVPVAVPVPGPVPVPVPVAVLVPVTVPVEFEVPLTVAVAVPVPVPETVGADVPVPVDAGLKVVEPVGDKDTDMLPDPLRDALLEVVRAGVLVPVALREAVLVGVRLAVPDPARLWDIDPDPLDVTADVIVADLLDDVDTVTDDEGILLDETAGDTDGVTDCTDDDVGVPEAGIVATSNPITAGGIHRAIGADVSAHGNA